jgi:hypothetical protein
VSCRQGHESAGFACVDIVSLHRSKKKLAEDQCQQVEISRASADNPYRETTQFSPEQFLRLETINKQKSVCQKSNCTFGVDDVAPILGVSK